MKLQHPETKKTFEVSEEHGEMLLSQGFYRLAPAVKRKTAAKKTKED